MVPYIYIVSILPKTIVWVPHMCPYMKPCCCFYNMYQFGYTFAFLVCLKKKTINISSRFTFHSYFCNASPPIGHLTEVNPIIVDSDVTDS